MGVLGDLGKNSGENTNTQVDVREIINNFIKAHGRDVCIDNENIQVLSDYFDSLKSDELFALLECTSFRLNLPSFDKFLVWDRSINRLRVKTVFDSSLLMEFVAFLAALTRLPFKVYSPNYGKGIFNLFDETQLNLVTTVKELNKRKGLYRKCEKFVFNIDFTLTDIEGEFNVKSLGDISYESHLSSMCKIAIKNKNVDFSGPYFWNRYDRLQNEWPGQGSLVFSRDNQKLMVIDPFGKGSYNGNGTQERIEANKEIAFNQKAIMKRYLSTIDIFGRLGVNIQDKEDGMDCVLALIAAFSEGFGVGGRTDLFRRTVKIKDEYANYDRDWNPLEMKINIKACDFMDWQQYKTMLLKNLSHHNNIHKIDFQIDVDDYKKDEHILEDYKCRYYEDAYFTRIQHPFLSFVAEIAMRASLNKRFTPPISFHRENLYTNRYEEGGARVESVNGSKNVNMFYHIVERTGTNISHNSQNRYFFDSYKQNLEFEIQNYLKLKNTRLEVKPFFEAFGELHDDLLPLFKISKLMKVLFGG